MLPHGLIRERYEAVMQPTAKQKGPISRKILAALEKEQRRRVIDFSSLRLGAERAEELEQGVISEADMRQLDPLHAVYIYAQNKLSVIVEPERCANKTMNLGKWLGFIGENGILGESQ